ncbi:nuclear transport factor 2 family protein [Streptomyces collinus]|uniref:nuclear transport factor 2 family protein n=1 Tax=Streptomyces collinus TaxID=42684 RepID=UPI0038190268
MSHHLENAPVVTDKDAAVVGEMLAAARRQDWDRVAELLDPEVVWSLPGNSRISGDAVGPKAVVERAQAIDAAQLTTDPQHLHIGSRSIVATIHNTADKPLPLDEWLALVFTVRSGRITTIDTHLSDVPMLERFYAATA